MYYLGGHAVDAETLKSVIDHWVSPDEHRQRVLSTRPSLAGNTGLGSGEPIRVPEHLTSQQEQPSATGRTVYVVVLAFVLAMGTVIVLVRRLRRF